MSEMREATLEERQSVDEYVRSISHSTGVTFEDCISREAALDAIGKAYGDIAEAEDNVRALPFVQPISRWIPVSERLPEEGKTVISSTKYGVYPETMYTKEYGWEWAYESGADYWRKLEDVTAWMPLPEQYKAESEKTDG